MKFDTKTNRWKVVVTCLVISTTFWFFSALNKDGYVTQINYPIKISYNQAKYVATKPLPDKIPIEVTGGGWDLMTRFFGLKMTAYELNIDDPMRQPYVITSTLRSDLSSLLEPITLNYFSQDSITYGLEALQTKTIRLGAKKQDWSSSLNDDFKISSDIQVTPDYVNVTGPFSLVNALPDTLWLLANESGIEDDVNTTVQLPPLPNLTSANLEKANVQFNVVRLLNIDVNLPVQQVGFPDENWQVTPSYIPISYQVAETNFSIEDTASIVLKAYFNELNQDSSLILQEEVLSEYILNVTFKNGKRVKVTRND